MYPQCETQHLLSITNYYDTVTSNEWIPLMRSFYFPTVSHTTRMDLITDDGDNTSQQDNLTGVTYEFIIKYKRDRSLWQSWWTCLNYASKLSIAYATKVKVSCTFQTKANWFFLVREQLTKTPWWYLHGHVQLINVYYCRAYGHTEEGSAKSPSLRNRTEDITW